MKYAELEQLKFVRLPSRPMEDLVLRRSVLPENVDVFIQKSVAQFDKNAIIRIRLEDKDSQLKKEISSDRPRQLIPESMNIQYGLEFYRNRRKE